MDNLLLEAACRELRREVVALPVHRVVAEGPERMLLLLGDGWGPDRKAGRRRRLHLDLGAGTSSLHLSRRRAVPAAAPTPFQGLLARELGGAVVVSLEKPAWDRTVTLHLRAGGRLRALVAEMMGARGSLLLLDETGTVLGHLHPASRVVVGRPYVAPPPPAATTPEALRPEVWGELLAAGSGGLARRLRRAIVGMSPALWDELERVAAGRGDPWERFRRWRERALEGAFEPCLYAAPAPEPGPDEPAPVLSPFPVQAPAGTEERRFDSAGAALDVWTGRLDAIRAARSLRDSLADRVHREEARLSRLETRLLSDRSREGKADEWTRNGEAILAGLGRARVEGDRVLLPDPRDPEGGSLEVAIDPRRSLQDNAARLFHRARKARRGRATVERRLEEVRRRLPALREARARLAAAGSLVRVRELEAELADAGLLRLVRRTHSRRDPPRAGSSPEVLPIRSYVSADGMEILLGRSGRENDRLTFRVAAPQDFWLHAQGFAGAHVVVRNPARLKRLPAATLRQAARLAAFHSKARGSGRVEVMVTARRNVRKGRGLPPGAVQVRRHESVQVEPTMPFSEREV